MKYIAGIVLFILNLFFTVMDIWIARFYVASHHLWLASFVALCAIICGMSALFVLDTIFSDLSTKN